MDNFLVVEETTTRVRHKLLALTQFLCIVIIIFFFSHLTTKKDACVYYLFICPYRQCHYNNKKHTHKVDINKLKNPILLFILSHYVGPLSSCIFTK